MRAVMKERIILNGVIVAPVQQLNFRPATPMCTGCFGWGHPRHLCRSNAVKCPRCGSDHDKRQHDALAPNTSNKTGATQREFATTALPALDPLPLPPPPRPKASPGRPPRRLPLRSHSGGSNPAPGRPASPATLTPGCRSGSFQPRRHLRLDGHHGPQLMPPGRRAPKLFTLASFNANHTAANTVAALEQCANDTDLLFIQEPAYSVLKHTPSSTNPHGDEFFGTQSTPEWILLEVTKRREARVCVYLHKRWAGANLRTRHDLVDHPHILCLALTFDGRDRLFVNVYNHPQSHAALDVLSGPTYLPDCVAIAGDFNIRHNMWDSRAVRT
ncbi:hypothetical protein K488DRAFT_92765 [Vararia minispora EC-137]|uniref:Uncharacterized protein n=1 Tax=Vararia minispora EC-137 TaxID=1314806 RepID=A0ACB8Q3R3_9AGAM|nr:hypothetical protein K488DRAFT_92765 [Vararia minispora EC-137]